MISLVAGLVLVATSSVCGALLLRLRGVVTLALGIAVLGAAEVVAVSHALSFFDAYTRGWLLAAVAAVAVVAVGATALLRPPAPALGHVRPVGRELLRDPVVAVLGVVVLLELGYAAALALFTPPTEYDVLTYHLTRAIFWIQQHSVGPVPGVEDTRINDFAPDAEILQGATMLLSGSIRYVGLVQLASLPAAVLAIYGTACRIGLSRSQAAFGALVFPTLTVVALQAPSALNDLVTAALIVDCDVLRARPLPRRAAPRRAGPRASRRDEGHRAARRPDPPRRLPPHLSRQPASSPCSRSAPSRSRSAARGTLLVNVRADRGVFGTTGGSRRHHGA